MDLSVKVNQTRYRLFYWREERTVVQKLALAFGMACVVGLAAQARANLPGSPVPVTMQTFAVLLAGVILGRRWGGVSVALYAGLGAVGVPWFSGGSSGLAYLAGPTGGYILGFALACLFVGYITDRYLKARRLINLVAIMLFADFVLIFVPGLLQLGLWLHLMKGETPSLITLLNMGLFPFVIGDIAKVIMAAVVARGIMPQRDYSTADQART